MAEIRAAQNGYILKIDSYSTEEVFLSLGDVFNRLLLHYEGLSSTFTGDSYGKVIIDRYFHQMPNHKE